MINYKLGCNFDLDLIYHVDRLNRRFYHLGAQVTEFFGSERQHSYLTARPPWRLPDIKQDKLESFISLCNHHNIEFNYTLNAINPGSKKFLAENKKNIIDFILYLKNIGVKRFTVASILLMEFIREADSTIPIEVSTIMHIDAITQIKWIKENFNIDKVCGALYKNRNISFIKKAAKLCKSLGIKYELMVNEFCYNASGKNKRAYGSPCVLRDSCYICHNSTFSKEEGELFNMYPMGYCINSRKDPISWLKTRFILPQDIKLYKDIGVTNFKITGRTGNTSYLLMIAEAYLKQEWNDNLLKLWKQLETIYTEENELEYKQPFEINCKVLSDNNFVNFWFENEEHRCEEEVCGETCSYCNDFYLKYFCKEN